MKKFTAAILAFAILFAFAACAEKQNTEPETTAKAETTAQANTETVTQEPTNAVNVNGNLTATEADFDTLAEITLGIVRCGANINPVFPGNDLMGNEYVELVRNTTPEDYENAYYYNSTSESALGDAMYMIFNTSAMGFTNFLDGLDIEVEKEVFSVYYNSDKYTPDPLNQYTDSFGYIRYNADSIDFVLRNVLCVEPDRTKTDDDFDSPGYTTLFNYYYYDGYYYYEYDEGGGGGPGHNVIDYTLQPDGSYIVKLSDYNESDTIDYSTVDESIDENYVYTIYEASAALKEIDGKKIWSVSYLKPAEYVVYVDTLQNS